MPRRRVTRKKLNTRRRTYPLKGGGLTDFLRLFFAEWKKLGGYVKPNETMTHFYLSCTKEDDENVHIHLVADSDTDPRYIYTFHGKHDTGAGIAYGFHSQTNGCLEKKVDPSWTPEEWARFLYNRFCIKAKHKSSCKETSATRKERKNKQLNAELAAILESYAAKQAARAAGAGGSHP